MPIYEYSCTNCGGTYKKLQSASAEKNLECACGGLAKRVISTCSVVGGNSRIANIAYEGAQKLTEAMREAQSGNATITQPREAMAKVHRIASDLI